MTNNVSHLFIVENNNDDIGPDEKVLSEWDKQKKLSILGHTKRSSSNATQKFNPLVLRDRKRMSRTESGYWRNSNFRTKLIKPETFCELPVHMVQMLKATVFCLSKGWRMKR